MPRERSWICERCGAEMMTHTEYKSHKLEHMHGNIPDKSVPELTGAESPEETEATEEIVAEPIVDPGLGKVDKTATGEQIKKDAPWNQPSTDDKKKQGNKLMYKYVGFCNECGGEVDTLEIDGILDDTKKQVVVSWCPTCHKKLKQRTVLKL